MAQAVVKKLIGVAADDLGFVVLNVGVDLLFDESGYNPAQDFNLSVLILELTLCLLMSGRCEVSLFRVFNLYLGCPRRPTGTSPSR